MCIFVPGCYLSEWSANFIENENEKRIQRALSQYGYYSDKYFTSEYWAQNTHIHTHTHTYTLWHSASRKLIIWINYLITANYVRCIRLIQKRLTTYFPYSVFLFRLELFGINYMHVLWIGVHMKMYDKKRQLLQTIQFYANRKKTVYVWNWMKVAGENDEKLQNIRV